MASAGRAVFFPGLLRESGYYTTNNSKTDYNTARPDKRRGIDAAWDVSGGKATYNNGKRKPGQPFFAVFNQASVHMVRVRSFTLEGRREFEGLPLDEIFVPPFLPDLLEVRSDIALHQEGINEVDQWVKQFLDDLEARGLKEETIVFFFSDHGGVQPREKAFPYITGFRVPMIVWVPEKWRDRVGLPMGEASDRLIGFEDLAPTVLSLAGVKAPDYMQGHDMLGPDAEPKKP
ncbi:Lipoteichoic acid synthase 2 [Pirellulimonas nuda]|uniref:Lipoteichoic acid synthase 2 n=1 Tax=Pirellulimonas nuda TaxID=2528009 RepID=A0A518DDR5_9BACT|nr:sulfatase-like hydrolase/transferase [Pirellulimonas nuda]QDU89619.1 Lipoteichoic acid synthase 2 [Pirellulimonas nuda]